MPQHAVASNSPVDSERRGASAAAAILDATCVIQPSCSENPHSNSVARQFPSVSGLHPIAAVRARSWLTRRLSRHRDLVVYDSILPQRLSGIAFAAAPRLLELARSSG